MHNSRCARIYCIRPDENPFWQNVSKRFIASTQWHTHTLQLIQHEHTRSNYGRDDLVLPFSGSFSIFQRIFIFLGRKHFLLAIQCSRLTMMKFFTQRNCLLLLFRWLWFAHATIPSPSSSEWIMTKVLLILLLLSILCERKGNAKHKKKKKKDGIDTVDTQYTWTFFFLLFRLTLIVRYFFVLHTYTYTCLHTKEERTFFGYACLCVYYVYVEFDGNIFH